MYYVTLSVELTLCCVFLLHFKSIALLCIAIEPKAIEYAFTTAFFAVHLKKYYTI
jgi:hypothetical protein